MNKEPTKPSTLSSTDVVVKVDGVSKKFCKSLKNSMLYGATDIIKSSFGIKTKSDKLRKDEFWALDDISFELKKGEALGIIGPNGSGKTTMLKMLNGIFMPDKGKIEMKGKVGALIELGSGFHSMLTGRENIYINGAILGMSKKEIDKKFDSIVEFADIGDFLDAPVKHYSSGMFVRLGFAIAIHSEPDVLLIDEILAVGDMNFQAKCYTKMAELIKKGISIVLVTHNRYSIQEICNRCLYLKMGKQKDTGETYKVVNSYLSDVESAMLKEKNQKELSEKKDSLITKIEILDINNNVRNNFQTGEFIRIRFHYGIKEPIKQPGFAITFLHNDKRYHLSSSSDYIFHAHSYFDGCKIENIEGKGYIDLVFQHIYLPIGKYKYSIYFYIDNSFLREKHEDLGEIEISWSEGSSKRTLFDLPRKWELGDGK
ncbi:MAG: ABC transporter ATP-binding protein [bacterium]|nr:ABC transporter ATP-binding protein [bacterium]